MGLKDKAFKYFFGDMIAEQVQGMGNLAQANMFQWLGKDMPIVTGDNFNYITKGYMQVPAVYECVDLIMKKIVSLPVLMYRVKSVQKEKQMKNLAASDNASDRAKALKMVNEVYEEVDIASIRRLLERPNELQTWDEFISMIVGLYLITGNSLVYGNASDKRTKKWSEVWALPFNPDNITIKAGSIWEPIQAYTVNYNSGQWKLDLPVNDIEHIKTPNFNFDPQGQWLFGMSPLRPYIEQLLRDKYGNDQANKMLYNGAQFGYITPKEPIDQLGVEQKANLKEQIREVIGSRDSAVRYIPGSIPLEWTPIGLQASDMQLMELIKLTREDIYRAYHIPLTYANNDQSTYNNAKENGKKLIYDAVAPVADVIFKGLTKFICDPYKEKIVLKPDYMSLPELSADMKELSEWLDKAWWLGWKEKREAMGYSKEISSDDVVLANKNLANITDILEGKTLNTNNNGTNNNNG